VRIACKIREVKIVRIKKKMTKRNVTLRITDELMKQIDEVSKEHNISRQKLVEAILKQVLTDKGFVLRIE
jgi:metal-responsive CopG/Arc/MetJ family transcriptional regulator